MKRLVLVVPIAVIGLALLIPAVGSAGTTAYAPKNCVKPAIKPHNIVIACGDGNFFIQVKDWSFFNQREAGGTGFAQVNDCNDNCSAGSFRAYAVHIHLTKVRTKKCGGERVPMFRKIEVVFKDAPPPSLSDDEKFPLTCIP